MTFREMWHNGSKRFLLVLIVICTLMFLVVLGIFVGVIFTLRQNSTVESVIENNTKKIQENQAEIQRTQQDQLKIIETTNQQWLDFQQHNQNLPVPITDPLDRQIEIKPPIRRPTPTPTPRPKVVIKYKVRKTPTPKPWFKRFEQTR